MRKSRVDTRATLVVAALVVIAALLRFTTLGVQSYWVDEAWTVDLVRLDLTEMLRMIPKTESTPPLYYILAWGWSRVFGDGEIGLRSLSALLGTALVPVAYLAARELVPRRGALVVAALIAVNPFLIWYSQEARSYILLALIGALSFLFFARALRRGGRGDVWLWAIASSCAMLSHYFAVFLVVPEAVLLVIRLRRTAIAATALVLASGGALLPLALHQRTRHYGFRDVALSTRAVQIPKQFLIGFDSPKEKVLGVVAILIALSGLWLFGRRAGRDEFRGARIAAVIAIAAIGAPIVLAALGADYLDTPNLIAALVPCTLVVAAGFASSRQGMLLFAVLCALSVGVVAAVAADDRYQRTNWRDAIRSLGPPRGTRAIVVTGSGKAMAFYASSARPVTGKGMVSINEVALVAVGDRTPYLHLGPGFAEVRRTRVQQLVTLLYRSKKAVLLGQESLIRSYRGKWRGFFGVFVQPKPRR
jgi:hypothetical protein